MLSTIASVTVSALRLLNIAALLDAAVCDVRSRTIPNRIVLAIAGSGLVIRVLMDARQLPASLLGGAIVYVALVFQVRRELIGGGDAKMIAAATLLVPPNQIVLLLTDIAIAGGMVSFIYLVMRRLGRHSAVVRHRPGTPLRTLRELLHNESARTATGQPIPYGLAVFAGVTFRLLADAIR